MTRRPLAEQVIEADPYLHRSDHFLMGDSQLWVEIAALTRTYHILEPLATYRVTGESATRSRDITKVLRFSASNSELFVYLCRKYKAPGIILAAHEAGWHDARLRLAFHAFHPGLADEVRRAQGNFTLKEWLRYWGAKYSAVHYGYRVAAALRSCVRRGREPWL